MDSTFEAGAKKKKKNQAVHHWSSSDCLGPPATEAVVWLSGLRAAEAVGQGFIA